MRSSFLALVGLSLMLPITASAVVLSGTAASVGQNAFSVTATPLYPVPFGQERLTFLSDSLDLANASVVVSVGGKVVYQGSVQPVMVPLGKAGVPVVATVAITSGGARYTQTLSLRPQEVALIAEPLASSPPLYPGKPNTPIEGSVRVVAVANLKNLQGRSLDPTALSYSWTIDGTQIANASGIGKQVVVVASPLQYRSRDVSVVVTSQDGSLVGGASLTLSPENPSVRVYENDPLLGIRYERALSDPYTIRGAEATLYVAPFSLSTLGGTPRIQWFLNGSSAQTGPLITLRPSGSGEGNASLSVVASAGDYSTATFNLGLIFGSSPGNIFGL
ncbi:MAG: hypothetical protein AAB442_01040 [Patescibacteria group bacterium]